MVHEKLDKQRVEVNSNATYLIIQFVIPIHFKTMSRARIIFKLIVNFVISDTSIINCRAVCFIYGVSPVSLPHVKVIKESSSLR